MLQPQVPPASTARANGKWVKLVNASSQILNRKPTLKTLSLPQSFLRMGKVTYFKEFSRFASCKSWSHCHPPNLRLPLLSQVRADMSLSGRHLIWRPLGIKDHWDAVRILKLGQLLGLSTLYSFVRSSQAFLQLLCNFQKRPCSLQLVIFTCFLLSLSFSF